MPPHLFVLFGATGDLARSKLFPALYRLAAREDGPEIRVLGVARSDWDDQKLREAAVQGLTQSGVDEPEARAWAEKTCHYARVGGYDRLGPALDRAAEIEGATGLGGNRVYYLALPPEAFPDVIRGLGRHEAEAPRDGWARLVVEKPFGRDLESARDLNALVHAYFGEEQTYRIDHFLGKETVQNLLVFRFANALFESVWSRQHVERVEILVAETNDAAGRAGYFEGAGTLRDMIQNHLTQLFALAAMEPPASLDAAGIRAEKVKVLRSTRSARPSDAEYGQYGAGESGEAEAYLDHEGVAEGSQTETFAAVRLHVDNWRWQGVPFVLRTGKRLPERVTEVAVVFRRPPVRLFQAAGPCAPSPNVLRIRLQPGEGFRLSFDVKAPGEGFPVSTQHLDFSYEEAFGALPDAYETLLRDVALGDPTLFVHADEAEEAWRVFEPLLEAPREVHVYPSGTWGPEAARRLARVGVESYSATQQK